MTQDNRQNEEELLILSDESDENIGLSLEDDSIWAISNDDADAVLFNTTVENSDDNTDNNDFLFSFDTENNSPEKEENNDFSLLVDEAKVDETSNDFSMLVEEDSNNNTDNSFSFDLNPVEDVTHWNWETMLDILEWAIAKFDLRSERIKTDIENIDVRIKDLKWQISDLEKQVEEKNKEKAELTAEKTAITKNIKSLEKMKTDSVVSDKVA